LSVNQLGQLSINTALGVIPLQQGVSTAIQGRGYCQKIFKMHRDNDMKCLLGLHLCYYSQQLQNKKLWHLQSQYIMPHTAVLLCYCNHTSYYVCVLTGCL